LATKEYKCIFAFAAMKIILEDVGKGQEKLQNVSLEK